ncbi:MAG: hypothetical protein MJ096_04485, partial [Clostridia bacterium]|nr:hypothetical protein [Clostridia bacterium]
MKREERKEKRNGTFPPRRKRFHYKSLRLDPKLLLNQRPDEELFFEYHNVPHYLDMKNLTRGAKKSISENKKKKKK